MALVLPILRLWLLFINVYGTFKVIKPPVPSAKSSNRNGQGPSARALQLRKRELKSRLAMWIVWASFLAAESILDRTASFVTPFYDELKCVALLFLLITRSHGAEAIFLHLIHPFIRPYVPAVDDILSHLHSVFELLVLLLLIPFEYITDWWSRPWTLPRLFRRKRSRDLVSDNRDDVIASPSSPAKPEEEKPAEENPVRSRLRQRTQSQITPYQEAERRAKALFDQINEAQDRVRVRTRSVKGQAQGLVTKVGDQGEDSRPSGSGLRTRKRLLEQSVYANPGPGSRNTGVHHLDPLTIAQLAKPAAAPSSSSHIDNDSASFYSLPTNSQTNNPPEIWIPPSFDDIRSTPQPQSRESSYRSPSPVYPPLPSAYPFTPRRKSEPSQTVATSPGRTARHLSQGLEPSASEAALQESRASDGLHPEDFFQQALESSTIHIDMDVDTMETLSTLNGSSATEGSTYEDKAPSATTVRKRGTTNRLPSPARNGYKRKGDNTESPKRSTRLRANETAAATTTASKDEFGFTVKSGPGPKTTQRRQPAAVTHKKSLARAKPSLNSDGEVLSDDVDSENVKKKRKTKMSPVDPKSSSVEKELLQSKEKASKTRINRTDIDTPDAFRSSRNSMKEVAESLRTVKRKS